MARRRLALVWGIGVVLALGLAEMASSQTGEQKKVTKGEKKKTEKKTTPVWTDPADPKLPADFTFQGEYVGTIQTTQTQRAGLFGRKTRSVSTSQPLGAQVIALGLGTFQAVLTPGGLPGAGWDGKNKILLDGVLEGSQVVFRPALGKRKYLAQKPDEFSATSTFPPPGHQNATASISGDVLSGQTEDGRRFTLQKTSRKSPTICAKPPAGAVVLFDGSNANEWTKGRIDKGILNTDGSDIVTKRKFNNYTVHVEFMLPYRPEARGQGRGNSGFYQVHHYEVQILDSFGLDGKNNETGGIYSMVEPKLNMCLPPLTWQTYDVDFTNAVNDASGKKIKNARVTVRLNGVVVQDNAEIPGPTGGHRGDSEGTPGPILLQGHGNPLQFRNIWIVEKK